MTSSPAPDDHVRITVDDVPLSVPVRRTVAAALMLEHGPHQAAVK